MKTTLLRLLIFALVYRAARFIARYEISESILIGFVTTWIVEPAATEKM